MRSIRMLVMIAIALCSSFASANATHSTDCELSLQQIFENQTHCVREIDGDKIYLKTENISISDKGIYVLLNELGDWALIPVLCTDAEGCFIHVGLTSGSDFRMNDAANNYKRTCPGCQTRYFTSCPNKDCPLKKKDR